MHTNPESLGDIIKYYREKSDYTVEELANKIGITERYLYRIENEGKKPSYNVLYKLIRILKISPELIFFPDSTNKYKHETSIAQLLNNCDEKTIHIIIEIIKIIIS